MKTETRTSIPIGIPIGAMCVQRFDDSRNSAIHTTYRISLRSSSLREPRDPLPKVVSYFTSVYKHQYNLNQTSLTVNWWDKILLHVHKWLKVVLQMESGLKSRKDESVPQVYNFCNDPSAGSPTETLLRLLLPLNDQVWSTSRLTGALASICESIRRPH